MSLRLRVVFAIALVLAIGAVTGIGVAGWQARQVLGEELGAALAGGRQTAAAAFEDLPTSNHPARDLRRLVVAFDGDRHLVAVLHDANGRIVARSRPLASRRGPDWFMAVFDVPIHAVKLAVPVSGYRDLILEPVLANDVGADWPSSLTSSHSSSLPFWPAPYSCG